MRLGFEFLRIALQAAALTRELRLIGRRRPLGVDDGRLRRRPHQSSSRSRRVLRKARRRMARLSRRRNRGIKGRTKR
ncbi:hypothetical protein [Candidatus Nitrospira bockiana]